MGRELRKNIHPKKVEQISIDSRTVEDSVVRATATYLFTFVVIFVASLLLISIEGKDLVTNFTAVSATINNVGPGLSLVGPTQNFAHFSALSKLVFIFDMLAGRLELIPILLLFSPTTWKKN
jgi:trk system potassium uptake protein TrkH